MPVNVSFSRNTIELDKTLILCTLNTLIRMTNIELCTHKLPLAVTVPLAFVIGGFDG